MDRFDKNRLIASEEAFAISGTAYQIGCSWLWTKDTHGSIGCHSVPSSFYPSFHSDNELNPLLSFLYLLYPPLCFSPSLFYPLLCRAKDRKRIIFCDVWRYRDCAQYYLLRDCLKGVLILWSHQCPPSFTHTSTHTRTHTHTHTHICHSMWWRYSCSAWPLSARRFSAHTSLHFTLSYPAIFFHCVFSL